MIHRISKGKWHIKDGSSPILKYPPRRAPAWRVAAAGSAQGEGGKGKRQPQVFLKVPGVWIGLMQLWEAHLPLLGNDTGWKVTALSCAAEKSSCL